MTFVDFFFSRELTFVDFFQFWLISLIFAPFCRLLEMAGLFPHGGGSPGAGGEPDIMSLHPRVRPFIPERYDPPTHVLPRAIFYHFTDFDPRAPVDLLL